MKTKTVIDEYRKLSNQPDTIKELIIDIRNTADRNEHFENMVFELGVKQLALSILEVNK